MSMLPLPAVRRQLLRSNFPPPTPAADPWGERPVADEDVDPAVLRLSGWTDWDGDPIATADVIDQAAADEIMAARKGVAR